MGFKYIGRAAACLVFSVAPGLVLANEFPVVDSCVDPVEFDGRHYKVEAGNNITWAAAKAAAEASEFEDTGVMGQLATITSEAEDRFVESLRRCARGNGTLSRNAVWVGGKQASDGTEPGGGWEWENGEGPISTPDVPLASYSNWLKNPDGTRKEPNNTGGNEEHLTVGHTNLFGWNDEGNLNNIGGYIIEYDTSSDVSVIDCIGGGCETTTGQTLLLPQGVEEDGSIGVRTFEFTDPRIKLDTCGDEPLTLFGDANDTRPVLRIPPYLCGSPRFLVVEVKRENFEIRQGTVFIENEPLLALPGNWYECDGQTFGTGAPLKPGDPQARDVVAWQATFAGDMLEDEIGGTVNEQFEGALGEFTFECGSSRGLTRNLSYLVIGMHINFGLDFSLNSDAVNERFVALTGYKLELLRLSVEESKGALKNGDYTRLRSHITNAIKFHNEGQFASALTSIEEFLGKVADSTYQYVEGENYGGEHLMRANNIRFTYMEKVIPFAP